MLYWTVIFPKHLADLDLIDLFSNTVILVLLSSCLLIALAFISNYGNRVSKSKFLEALTTFSISGYAIPGVILAVAFISFISWFDNYILGHWRYKANFYRIYSWSSFSIFYSILFISE